MRTWLWTDHLDSELSCELTSSKEVGSIEVRQRRGLRLRLNQLSQILKEQTREKSLFGCLLVLQYWKTSCKVRCSSSRRRDWRSRFYTISNWDNIGGRREISRWGRGETDTVESWSSWGWQGEHRSGRLRRSHGGCLVYQTQSSVVSELIVTTFLVFDFEFWFFQLCLKKGNIVHRPFENQSSRRLQKELLNNFKGIE